MAIAIAAIRKAAEELRANSKKPVTAKGIAEVLGVSSREVREYLSGVSGLAKEIGMKTPKRGTTEDACAAIAAELKAEGIPVTRAQIAERSGFTRSAINSLLIYHPQYIQEWNVITENEATAIEMRLSLQKIVEDLGRRHAETNLTEVAELLSIKISTLQKRMQADPSLRSIIQPFLRLGRHGPARH